MANPEVFRGFLFTGVINLKQDDGTSPDNVLPYVIPGGAAVEIILPQDSELVTPVAVVLSSATALPAPLVGNEVVVVNATLGQISFTCPMTKSALMGVGKNLAIDVRVVKDPPYATAVNVDFFQKVKVIDVADPANLQA